MKTSDLTSPQIATREAVQWFSSLWNHLPNPDVVLKTAGKNVDAYRELLYDAHTAACEQSRKSGTLSLEWMLQSDATDAQAAQQLATVQQCLERLNVLSVMEQMLDAPLYGLQPLEVLWEVQNGLVLPSAIIGKPPEWFVFDSEGALRLKTKDSMLEGVELPPYRFLVVQHRATYANPYGVAVLSRVWWAQFFKRNVQRFWNTFTEKFGTPFVLIKHDFGNDQTRLDDLLNAVTDMVQDAVIAIPQGATAELVGVTGTTNADMYKDFLSFCNAEISKAILGQTLSTETNGTGGSYAATKVHFDVRGEIIEADKRLVEQSMNQLVQWIYTLNFGESAKPAKFVLFESSDVDKVLAERDKILWEMGVRFTKSYYVNRYGLKDGDFELTEPVAVPPPAAPALPTPQPAPELDFAAASLDGETVQEALDAAVMQTKAAEWQRQAEGLVSPLVALIKNASSFDEVQKGLLKTYSKMDAARLSERLAGQLTLIDALGVRSIQEEAGADFSMDFADDVPAITPARIAQAFNLPPEEALAFLFGKESTIYKSFKDVSPEVFRVVFTVAGVVQMDVLVAIRSLVEKALAEGQSFDDFKKAMTESELIARVLPVSRFQTIYRTNLQSAFMAARWREQVRIGERKPYWKFVAVMDGSTTQGCRDLDGKVFKHDDGFWATNYPPRHYNCRSRVVALNARELERYGGSVEEGKNYEDVEPDPSFATTPDVPFKPNKKDYPSDIWKEYEKRTP
jgi:SPP1 gp7 family putative phage head morphogenesis protein